jgi:hypothetical protein
MNNVNISLLVGMPRSGSTYLSKLLGTNPEISISKSTCHIPGYITALQMGFNNELTKDTMIFSTPEKTQNAFETFVRGGVLENCKLNSANIFKCTGYMHHIDLFHSIFDNPKYIYLVRDLGDVVHSIRLMIENNTWKFNSTMANGDKINYILSNTFISKYLMQLQYDIDKIKKYKNNFIVVKYEDLCLNTDKTLLEISNFIGVNSNYDFSKIDLTNYDFDANHPFPISHDVEFKEIKYKKHEDDAYFFVEDMLRENFKNFYQQFNY